MGVAESILQQQKWE